MTARSPCRTAATKSRGVAVGAIAVAGALLPTACGDQTKAGRRRGASKQSAAPLFAQAAEEVPGAGVIKVGTTSTYAPDGVHRQDGKIVGIDPDIGAGARQAARGEVHLHQRHLRRPDPGPRHRPLRHRHVRYDRHQGPPAGIDDNGKKVGKGVDFVDYFSAGSSIYMQKGNPKGIKNSTDLCGKTIAVQRGTIYETAPKAQAKTCAAVARRPSRSSPSTTTPRRRPGCESGGAVADIERLPGRGVRRAKRRAAARTSRSSASRSTPAPFGIAVHKDNIQLRGRDPAGDERDHQGRHVPQDPGRSGARQRAARSPSTAASDQRAEAEV